MSHTPGPWRAVIQKGDGGYSVGAYIEDAGRGWIAQLWGKNEEDFKSCQKETIANAALIASAPYMKDEIDRLKAEKADMLAMLEELRECSVLSWWSGGGVPVGIVERIDEVIRKAWGEK